MTELSKKWIEIGLKLSENPTLKIKCPVCEKGYIEVVDKPIPSTNKKDRYLICNNCKSWNVITMDDNQPSSDLHEVRTEG